MTITPETYGCVIREETGEELMVIPPRAMKLLSTNPQQLPESLRSTREALEFALNVPSCYAIYDPVTQRIKIGSSVHPVQRLRDLQVGSPTTLHLLMVWHAVSPSHLEAFVQEELREFRVRGEWFDARGAADALPALRVPVTTSRRPVPSLVKPAPKPLLAIAEDILTADRRERRAVVLRKRTERGLPATCPPKLAGDQRDRLIRLYRSGEPVDELAALFGVSRRTVFRYVRNAA
ncbi:MAG: helix-turn-helix domain-containing protein [Microthrixaceae bacterium]|nr:helix-turn-helix domain-containing protein [Microthrixaceae bacterium]